eukprot:Nk52_evm3s251 gene=Nk52_evmTU3s251
MTAVARVVIAGLALYLLVVGGLCGGEGGQERVVVCEWLGRQCVGGAVGRFVGEREDLSGGGRKAEIRIVRAGALSLGSPAGMGNGGRGEEGGRQSIVVDSPVLDNYVFDFGHGAVMPSTVSVQLCGIESVGEFFPQYMQDVVDLQVQLTDEACNWALMEIMVGVLQEDIFKGLTRLTYLEVKGINAAEALESAQGAGPALPAIPNFAQVAGESLWALKVALPLADISMWSLDMFVQMRNIALYAGKPPIPAYSGPARPLLPNSSDSLESITVGSTWRDGALSYWQLLCDSVKDVVDDGAGSHTPFAVPISRNRSDTMFRVAIGADYYGPDPQDQAGTNHRVSFSPTHCPRLFEMPSVPRHLHGAFTGLVVNEAFLSLGKSENLNSLVINNAEWDLGEYRLPSNVFSFYLDVEESKENSTRTEFGKNDSVSVLVLPDTVSDSLSKFTVWNRRESHGVLTVNAASRNASVDIGYLELYNCHIGNELSLNSSYKNYHTVLQNVTGPGLFQSVFPCYGYSTTHLSECCAKNERHYNNLIVSDMVGGKAESWPDSFTISSALMCNSHFNDEGTLVLRNVGIDGVDNASLPLSASLLGLIDLSQNAIQTLPRGWIDATGLNRSQQQGSLDVNMSGNRMVHLFLDIKWSSLCNSLSCYGLLRLDLSSNKIESLHATLSNAFSVGRGENMLLVSDNQISSVQLSRDIPAVIDATSTLEAFNTTITGSTSLSIDLSSNKLSQIAPNSFQNLSSLVSLQLANNGLTVIRDGFLSGRSCFLQRCSIDLSQNNLGADIESLEQSIVSLDFEGSLFSLNLSRNALTDVPTEIASALVRLSDKHSLPYSVKTGLHLEEEYLQIILSHNNITSVSGSLCQGLDLEEEEKTSQKNIVGVYFDLSFNQITTVTEDIFSCGRRLVLLNMNNNPITKLPSLTRAHSLVMLSASNSGILELPWGYGNPELMPHLKSIYINGAVDVWGCCSIYLLTRHYPSLASYDPSTSNADFTVVINSIRDLSSPTHNRDGYLWAHKNCSTREVRDTRLFYLPAGTISYAHFKRMYVSMLDKCIWVYRTDINTTFAVGRLAFILSSLLILYILTCLVLFIKPFTPLACSGNKLFGEVGERHGDNLSPDGRARHGFLSKSEEGEEYYYSVHYYLYSDPYFSDITSTEDSYLYESYNSRWQYTGSSHFLGRVSASYYLSPNHVGYYTQNGY